MKKIIVILFMGVLPIAGYAQSENEIHDLINRSLENHIASIEELIEKKTVASDYLDRITLLSDNVPDSFELSKELREKHNLKFLNYRDFSRSELRTGIVTLQLYPLVLKDDAISITIGNVIFSKKGKKNFLSYGNWYTVSVYKYSCGKKEWELIKTEEKGI